MLMADAQDPEMHVALGWGTMPWRVSTLKEIKGRWRRETSHLTLPLGHRGSVVGINALGRGDLIPRALQWAVVEPQCDMLWEAQRDTSKERQCHESGKHQCSYLAREKDAGAQSEADTNELTQACGGGRPLDLSPKSYRKTQNATACTCGRQMGRQLGRQLGTQLGRRGTERDGEGGEADCPLECERWTGETAAVFRLKPKSHGEGHREEEGLRGSRKIKQELLAACACDGEAGLGSKVTGHKALYPSLLSSPPPATPPTSPTWPSPHLLALLQGLSL